MFASAAPAQAVDRFRTVVKAMSAPYEQFLQLTKACCSRIQLVAEIESLNGPDDVTFRSD